MKRFISGAVLGLALACSIEEDASVLEAHEEAALEAAEEEDAAVIDDEDVEFDDAPVLERERTDDPPADYDPSAAADAFATDPPVAASVSCLDDSDCPGDCVLYGNGFTAGYCRIIVCDSNSDCEAGEPCTGGICANTCSQTTDCLAGETCSSGFCINLQPGSANFCNSLGCSAGQGDCDSDAQCAGSMPCRFFSGTDYCGNGTGATEFCTPGSRCGYGGADCDTNADCFWPYVCRQNVGSHYGYESWVDVCTF